MSTESLPRILCVDDEVRVLDGLARALRSNFDITTAVGGAAGMAAVRSSAPFAVVMSDLRMPDMDGVTFLSVVMRLQPETVRVLLTGYADMKSAIDAVNDGAVFRFLTKPTSPAELNAALSAAVEQHRLITAQRVLLEQTLLGSIKAVTDILALVSPAGFGRGLRAKTLVGQLSAQCAPSLRWQVEIAAMLSQVGSVTLPADTVERHYRGESLTGAEANAVARLPHAAADLIASIPRLETVRSILLYQGARFDEPASADEAVAAGAALLKVVLDFDMLESQDMTAEQAISTMRSRFGSYDPKLLDALAGLRGITSSERIVEVEMAALRPGMVIVADVKSESGMLLIARGQEVTERMVDRLRMMSDVAARPLVRVRIPQDVQRRTA